MAGIMLVFEVCTLDLSRKEKKSNENIYCTIERVFNFSDIRQSNEKFYQRSTAKKAIRGSQNILF